MNGEARKQSIRAAFAAMAQGDPSILLQLFSPELTYTVIGSTRFSTTVHGLDEMITRIVTPLASALSTPLVLEIEHMIAQGDHVAWQAHGRSTLLSGASYNNTYCFVFRFDGERVIEVTEYLDTALVERAFSVPADRPSLLQHMDLNLWEMFREMMRLSRGSELFETPGFWMAYNPRGSTFHNMVMVRDSVPVDDLVMAISEFYGRRHLAHSVWLRDHADAALEAALRERGYIDFTSMPGMVLLRDPAEPAHPPDLEIRAAQDERGRCDFLSVVADAYATYGAPRDYAEDAFYSLASVCAPHVQGFVGYVHGVPVASAAVYVTHRVAGIGWVGTIPEYRKRGYGEAVTWAAVREGFRRGASFANLQASPMGAPVYQRMGFITPTQYRVLAPLA